MMPGCDIFQSFVMSLTEGSGMAVLGGLVLLVLLIAAGVALAPYLVTILGVLGFVAVCLLLLCLGFYVVAWALRLFDIVAARPIDYLLRQWHALTGPRPRT
jgi:hypothetical protein